MTRTLALTLFTAMSMAMTGCTWADAGSGAPTESAVPPPQVGPADDDGFVTYVPDFTEGSLELPPPRIDTLDMDAGMVEEVDMPEDTELVRVCQYERFEYTVPAEKAKPVFLPGVYDTLDFKESTPSPWNLQRGEHVHLAKAELVMTRGPDLSFLSWVKIWVRREGLSNARVAWGEDLGSSSRRVALRVDGSVDLAPYVDNRIRLLGEARAASPTEDVEIGAELAFDVYYDCEWR